MKRCLISLFLVLASSSVFAWQPTKPVEITVPFPAGSGNDLVIRPLAEAAEKKTGVKFVIVNRPGAGGTVGSSQFVKMPNDGHHINIISVGGLAAMDYTFPAFHDSKTSPYSVESFSYAVGLAKTSLVVIANKNDKVENPKQFIDVLLKDKNVVVADSGGAGRLALETILLNVKAREKNPSVIRVEHKGPAETMTDIIGGHVRFGTVPLSVAYQQFVSGNIKIVGLVQQEKISSLNVSSFNEINKNIEAQLIWGIALPKDTAPEILEWYAKVFNEAKKDPKVKEYFAKNYFFDVSGLETPKTFTEYVKSQQKQHSSTVSYIVQTMKK